MRRWYRHRGNNSQEAHLSTDVFLYAFRFYAVPAGDLPLELAHLRGQVGHCGPRPFMHGERYNDGNTNSDVVGNTPKLTYRPVDLSATQGGDASHSEKSHVGAGRHGRKFRPGTGV